VSNIKVHSTGAQGFTPSPFPTGGTVAEGDAITFQAAGSSDITFYAESGLFYQSGNSGPTNTSATAFTAPASGELTLVVAATSAAGYKLSLSATSLSSLTSRGSGGCEDDDPSPSDGTINVGTKTKRHVKDWRDHAPPRHAPARAMQARGSD